jgi:EAL domain-containing protein (putative c-di-GMP-specific phosphodiesterase class I)
MLQGYYFSRPLSPENFRTYLEKEKMLKREQ